MVHMPLSWLQLSWPFFRPCCCTPLSWQPSPILHSTVPYPLPTPQHRSPLHGWGMFAGQAIPRDAFVIEYTGEVVPNSVAGK